MRGLAIGIGVAALIALTARAAVTRGSMRRSGRLTWFFGTAAFAAAAIVQGAWRGSRQPVSPLALVFAAVGVVLLVVSAAFRQK